MLNLKQAVVSVLATLITANTMTIPTTGPDDCIVPEEPITAAHELTEATQELTIPRTDGNIIIEMPHGTDGFELPVRGATGYAAATAIIRAENSNKSAKLGSIPAGGMFLILQEDSPYMQVEYNNITGYVHRALVMVNLPDVIPSITYNATNGYSSIFKSSGYDLNNITSEKLYTGKTPNARLGYEEFNMPVLYNTAKKLAKAQQQALADGNCIILYEAFRPRAVQKLVNTELANLMASNKTVNKNINDGTWGKNWFIARSLSNHQMGFAMDVSLGKIQSSKALVVAEHAIRIPDEVQELPMPTAMHELSNKAVALARPVDSLSKTAWKNVPYAPSMTDAAKQLRDYFTENNMYPLASEWWHFNDLDARNEIKSIASPVGEFEITGNISREMR